MNMIKKIVKAVIRPDCHARLECALKEAKERGFCVDKKAAMVRIQGGINAPKRV